MNITLNASDLGLYSRFGQELPPITATIRDLGTAEAMYFSFLVFVCAVVMHELGHWIYLLRHNANAEMRIVRKGIGIQLQTGVEEDYERLTTNNKIALYSVGVVLGLVPIVIAGFIHPIYFLVLPAYIVGLWGDIMLIARNLAEKDNEKVRP